MDYPHLPYICDHCGDDNAVIGSDECPLCEIIRLRTRVRDLEDAIDTELPQIAHDCPKSTYELLRAARWGDN